MVYGGKGLVNHDAMTNDEILLAIGFTFGR
jgi:hypothetical protein